MNVCFITKYPPIQGGVSMRCYWLARELAKRGHRITVVTNAMEVEREYRMTLTHDDRAWYEGSFPESGGAVTVRHTATPTDSIHHIPFTNPFVTKLSALATDTIRELGCTKIFSYYLEPYGVAAHLASRWTGVPYIVRHAGSDVGRLMKDPGLRTTYAEVFRAADFVMTGKGADPFLAMGVDRAKIWVSKGFPLPDIFSPEVAPANLERMVVERAEPDEAGRQQRAFDPTLPTIGLYGKLGVPKGSFDLLHALAKLKRQGLRFNFVAISQGKAREAFLRAVRELDLEHCTWALPFVPHWRIPEFIRACTCVCFLERDFPITFHGPTIPREVFACGTCLVVSREVAAKQVLRSPMVDGEHAFIVNDPKDHEELAAQIRRAIADPGRAASVGRAGLEMYLDNRSALTWDDLLSVFEERLTMMTPQTSPAATAPSTPRAEPPLPLTQTVLGDKWRDIFDEYARDTAACDSPFLDAVRMAEYLERRLRPGDAPVWFGDLLRYERAQNRLYLAQREGYEQLGDDPALRAAEREVFARRIEDEVLALRPRLSPHVEILAFDYDLSELCAALQRNEVPESVAQRPTTILFKPENNFFGEELVINGNVAHLLSRCDGERSIRDLIELFAVGDSDFEQVKRQLVPMIKQLAIKQVIRCVHHTTPVAIGV